MCEAEDLLSEEDLGSHILGIYPAGTRTFGIESASPTIICLYVDTIDSILNPSIHERKTWRKYHVGENLNAIYMVELHEWACSIATDTSKISYAQQYDQFMDAALLKYAPGLHDALYQSSSIDEIIASAEDVLEYKRLNRQLDIPAWRCDSKVLEDVLALRTLYIYTKTGMYCPNINPNWGDVVYLQSFEANGLYANEIIELDMELIDCALSGTRGPLDSLSRYKLSLASCLRKVPEPYLLNSFPHKDPRKEFNQKIINFYKQLA